MTLTKEQIRAPDTSRYIYLRTSSWRSEALSLISRIWVVAIPPVTPLNGVRAYKAERSASSQELILGMPAQPGGYVLPELYPDEGAMPHMRAPVNKYGTFMALLPFCLITLNGLCGEAQSAPISVGSAGALQQSGGSGQPITVDTVGGVNTARIDLIDHSATFFGPKVDITNPVWASGSQVSAHPGTTCTTKADRTGTNDSTCAIANAWLYQQYTTFGGQSPCLYVPAGNYIFHSTSGTGDVLSAVAAPVCLEGDGWKSSSFQNLNPQAALIVIPAGVQAGYSRIRGIRLEGNGHVTTGDLIDAASQNQLNISDVELYNSGGKCLNIQGNLERSNFHDLHAQYCRQVFSSWGDTNEDYLHDFDFSFNGNDVGNWFYDSNANPYTGQEYNVPCSGTPSAWASGTNYGTGAVVTQGGTEYSSLASGNVGNTPQLWSTKWQACGMPWRPESRPAVVADGDNWNIDNGSIKETNLSGSQLARGPYLQTNVYYESNNSSHPSFSYSTQLVGKAEIGHGMSELTTAGLSAVVDDAGWHSEYMTNPVHVLDGSLSTTRGTCIFPIDADATSSARSAYVPSINRNQYECVTIYGYSGQGQISGWVGSGSVHINGRHQAGGPVSGATVAPLTGSAGPVNTAIDWPAPTTVSGVLQPAWVITETPASAGSVTLISNHLEMLHDAGMTGVCGDNAMESPTAQWLGNPSDACAENWIGAVVDGYSVPSPVAGYHAPPAGVTFISNLLNNGFNEVAGEGWTKISSNGGVSLLAQTTTSVGLFNPATIFNQYLGGNVFDVETIPWGAANTASSTVEDLGKFHSVTVGPYNTTIQNNFDTFDAWVNAEYGGGGGLVHQVHFGTGAGCTYTTSSGATAAPVPSAATCVGSYPGGVFQAGGGLVNTPIRDTNYLYPTPPVAVAIGISDLIGPLSGTYTLPLLPDSNPGWRFRIFNQGSILTLVPPTGAKLQLNNALYSTLTMGSFYGLMEFVYDGINGWVYVGPDYEAPASITAGVGLGTQSAAIALGAGSSINRGTVTVSTSAAGAASSTLFTLAFTTTKNKAPIACTLHPKTSAAVNATLDISDSTPTTTGWAPQVLGSSLPAGQYTWEYECTL